MKISFLGLGFLVASSSVFAGASDFTGFSMKTGVTFAKDSTSAQTDYSYTNKFAGSTAPPGFSFSSAYSLNASHPSSIPAFIGADYTLALGETTTLGLTLSADSGYGSQQISSGTFNMTNPTASPDNPNGYQMITTMNTKNHLSFGVEPGWVVSQNCLAKLRLAYHKFDADFTTTSSVTSGVNPARVLTNPSSSTSFSGWGFGGGGKYRINNNWFAEANFEYIKYGSKTVLAPSLVSAPDEITLTQTQSIAPTKTTVSFAVGYKF